MAYFRAFTAVFEPAERDPEVKMPFGHLVTDEESDMGTRIKAILLDEQGRQIKGISMYFQSKYSADDDDYHILWIVKTYQVHYTRSIQKLEKSKKEDREHQINVTLPRVLIISIIFPSQGITYHNNCRPFWKGTEVHQGRSSTIRKQWDSELAFRQRR